MGYTPSPWGREYHALRTNQALGGGAAGGGKSLVLLHDADEQILLQHARCQAREFAWGRAPGAVLHLRKEHTRLEETMHRARQAFPELDPKVKWDGDEHTWYFSSGFRYKFGHLAKPDSYLNYRSAQYTKLKIDEAGEIQDENVFHELDSRVRTDDPVLAPLANTRCMSNPFPGWLRDYFVEPAKTGRKILAREIELDDGTKEIRTRIFLPAKLSDNPSPAFRRQYETSLKDKPYHIRAAQLDGNWYVIAGAFFAEVWDPARIVIKPFVIDPYWRRFRTLDWGYMDTCVVLWWTVTPDGELICYRERTYNKPNAKRRFDAREVALKIKEVELAHGEWNRMRNQSRIRGWADTQLWTDIGGAGAQGKYRGRTMAHDMEAEGVYHDKAIKGRIQAAQQMVKRCNRRGYADRAGIMYFENCEYCIATIPAIGVDPSEPEAPASGGPDHGWDATQFALNANPLPEHRATAALEDEDDKFFRDEVVQQQPRGNFGYGGN